MEFGPKYIYCGREDPGWELDLAEEVSSPLAACTVIYLYSTGAISAQQRVRKFGDDSWSEICKSELVIRRTAYGDFIPKLFKSDRECWWYYKGPSNETQGPFTSADMLKWFQGGYLYEQLKICAVSNPKTVLNEHQFCSIKDSVLYLTQPFYPNKTSQQDPIEYLTINGGRKDSLFPFHKIEDLRNLPQSCPISGAVESTPVEEDEEQVDPVETIQEALDQLGPAAMKLFLTDRSRMWYYLGQSDNRRVNGPFQGDLMFSWFQHGWLSESVRVWSTEKEVVRLDRREFKPLMRLIESNR